MERAREGVCCARSPGWVRREALWLRVDKVSVKTHLGHAQFALAWRLWLEVWWSCSSRARTRSRTVSCLCARLVCPTALVGLEIEAAGGAGHRPRAVVLGCMSPKNGLGSTALRVQSTTSSHARGSSPSACRARRSAARRAFTMKAACSFPKSRGRGHGRGGAGGSSEGISSSREEVDHTSYIVTRCGNRHQKLGAHYFDEGFFT